MAVDLTVGSAGSNRMVPAWRTPNGTVMTTAPPRNSASSVVIRIPLSVRMTSETG